MEIPNIFKSPGIASAITIALLLSSYIFIMLYNNFSATMDGISTAARFFFFLTLVFLFLFLASFIIFLIAMFHMADIRGIFKNPTKISIMSAVLLLCSYLSSVMNGYSIKIYGELASTTKIFLYLALVFLVFFIAGFIATIVSFSDRFLYSKNL